MAGLFDTHCHLMATEYKENTKEIINKAITSGVSKMCAVGFDLESSQQAATLATHYDEIYAIVGIHPTEVGRYNNDVINEIDSLANSNQVVAIGEIGLDYFHKQTSPDLQKEWFIKQINIAKKKDIPVSIHCREAYEDTYKILKEHNVKKGLMHCYLGDLETAKKFIELGFYISISGVITFKNAKSLQELVKNIPISKMLIETDSPYLTPEPYRGEINFPSYVKYVAQKIASLKNITTDEVIRITSSNANKLFNIK
ncbi:TatD family hydrolase [Spiroplasma endosymbiont of Amphibalanus improvisus]|uniref:TatD family hydrolase n=1 Tax=Spiroplasma endosymbiont of Amphibalanus improvisus TaxID=3066327 RepID=UPI00313EEC53